MTLALAAPPTASRFPLPVPGRDGVLDGRCCERLISASATTVGRCRVRAAPRKRFDSSRSPIPPQNGEGGPPAGRWVGMCAVADAARRCEARIMFQRKRLLQYFDLGRFVGGA